MSERSYHGATSRSRIFEKRIMPKTLTGTAAISVGLSTDTSPLLPRLILLD